MLGIIIDVTFFHAIGGKEHVEPVEVIAVFACSLFLWLVCQCISLLGNVAYVEEEVAHVVQGDFNAVGMSGQVLQSF